MKPDALPKPRSGRRFWLSVPIISLGLLALGELLIRRDTLSLVYSLPSPRFVVVILVGIALVGGCLLMIWLYPRVRTARPRLALVVALLTSLCLIGSILLLSDSVFVITQPEYQESETAGLSTYRLTVDDLGQLSDIHQMDVVVYHCDALGVICWPTCRWRTDPATAYQSYLDFDSVTGHVQVRFENTVILSC
jgi:hypothetical protein